MWSDWGGVADIITSYLAMLPYATVGGFQLSVALIIEFVNSLICTMLIMGGAGGKERVLI